MAFKIEKVKAFQHKGKIVTSDRLRKVKNKIKDKDKDEKIKLRVDDLLIHKIRKDTPRDAPSFVPPKIKYRHN